VAAARAGLYVASSLEDMEKVLAGILAMTSLDAIAGDVCKKAFGDRTASNTAVAVAFIKKLSRVRKKTPPRDPVFPNVLRCLRHVIESRMSGANASVVMTLRLLPKRLPMDTRKRIWSYLHFSTDECALCYECLEPSYGPCPDWRDRPGLQVLPCGHLYHAECLREALANNPRCPYCQAKVRMKA
jgi:hypothetical protein